MSLVPCRECGEQISSSAKTCPKCGAKVPRFKWWLWVPVGLVVAFFAIGITSKPSTPQEAYEKELKSCLGGRDWSHRTGMTQRDFCEMAARIARDTFR